MAARSFWYLALFVSAPGALVGAVGCADDGVSLHVICPILPEVEDDLCTFSAEGDACVGEGVMNIASAESYRMSLRVESGLTPRARDVPPQGEPNGIQMRSAEIELRDPSGARLVFDNPANANPYRVVASGYVPPGGVGSITVTAIDKAHRDGLSRGPAPTAPQLEQILVSVKLKGKTSGDQEVEAGEYIWPVRLINLDPSSNSCRMVSYCSESFGQDNYAEACRL